MTAQSASVEFITLFTEDFVIVIIKLDVDILYSTLTDAHLLQTDAPAVSLAAL